MTGPAPDTPRGVRIDATPGHAAIRLDGIDVSDGVIGYQLSHDIRTGLPSLILHTTAPEGVVFEGLARVAVGVDQPPGELVAEFLAGVDPQALDRAALERDDLGTGRGAVARAMLATLTDWARAATREEG